MALLLPLKQHYTLSAILSEGLEGTLWLSYKLKLTLT